MRLYYQSNGSIDRVAELLEWANDDDHDYVGDMTDNIRKWEKRE